MTQNAIHKIVYCSNSDYLIELRINRAKLLLEKTDMPIEQIAALVGYNNKGFFYQKFVEQCGMKPAIYRKSVDQNS